MSLHRIVLISLFFLTIVFTFLLIFDEPKTDPDIARVAECEKFTQDELDAKIGDGEAEYLHFQWCAGYLGAYYGAKAR